MKAIRAIEALRWTLVILSVLVSGQALLGFLGLFGGVASGLFGALVLAGIIGASWRAGLFSLERPLLEGWRPVETGLLAAVVVRLASFVWTAAGRNTFTYDSLSFHLHFPASWMHAARIEIVPMVFGDVAPAYNPSNVELLIHLLMAPLRSSYLAECGQIPFAFVAVLAIYATARQLEAGRAAALCGCLAFLLIPEVAVQATVSMVDLAVGAMLLATLPFLLRLWSAPTQRDVLSLAVAWGLFIGTKFIALPYSAPLLLAVAAILWRHRHAIPAPSRVLGISLAVVAIVFASGGFWYLRNALVTGNPVFPLDIDLLGVLRVPGLYGSALMREWDYHHPIAQIGDLGQMLLGSGVGFAVAGALALFVRWRGPELPLAVIQLAIFWCWIPYQHSRFLFGIFGVVSIALAVATRERRLAGASWLLPIAAIGGAVIQSPDAGTLVVLAAGLGGGALPLLDRRVSLRVPALLAGLVFAIVIGLGLGPYRDRYPGYSYNWDYYRAWEWVHTNVTDAHVAYSGANLPFPLYGRNLSNRVSYVNVSSGPYAKVHDFRPQGPATTPEPTHYRVGSNFDAWLANLEALRCDFLFVSAMFPIVLRNVEHDAEGYPVERAWADAHPQTFPLLYATEDVRIYAIKSRGG